MLYFTPVANVEGAKQTFRSTNVDNQGVNAVADNDQFRYKYQLY